MSGLAILSWNSNSDGCASGIIFYYSDGSSYQQGYNYGTTTSTLYFSNPGGLTSVNSWGYGVLDHLQICVTSGCTEVGNIAGRPINYNAPVSSSWTITGLWGSYGTYSGRSCLAEFGIYYY
jgi:hypothetical protein